jgi:hypothetical protein
MKVQAGPRGAPGPGAHDCAWRLLSVDVDGHGGTCRNRGAMASRGRAVGRSCPLGATVPRIGGVLHDHGESHLAHLRRCNIDNVLLRKKSNIDNVRERARFPCAIRLDESEGVVSCETGWDHGCFTDSYRTCYSNSKRLAILV